MSYYGIYPNVSISYMRCSTCSAETFSWLAESFNCAVCNGNEHVSPQAIFVENVRSITDSEEEIQVELAEQYQDELQRYLAKVRESETRRRGEAECGKKRKRSLSDIGGR
jgi:predicted adenine nucleotide alpha hydrolase (AANH) superfamily ATPase